MRRVLFAGVAVALGIAACSEVPANNPYDPTAPVAQQEKGLVRGTVVFPAGITLAGLPAGSAVELVALGEPEPVNSVVIHATEAPEGSDAGAGDGRERFAFVFENVSAGLYRVVVRALGFTHEAALVEVAIGARAVVDIDLEVDTAEGSLGRVSGIARLAAGGEDGHAGIGVRVVGRPDATETESDGAYVIELPTGVYALRFSAPHYETETVPGVEVRVGEETDLRAQPVVLVGAPGTLRGRVVFPPDVEAGAALFAQVEVRLWQADQGPEEMPIAASGVNAGGAFTFDSLQGGDYRLLPVYADDGFIALEHDVTLPVGETINVGVLPLFAGETRAVLHGNATLEGADDYGGIRVEALGLPGSVLTAADGAYEIVVPPGEWILRYTRAGYRAPDEAVGSVGAGERVEVRDVVLAGEPGRVRGTVTLAQGATPEALERIVVCLVRPDGPGPDGPEPNLRPCDDAMLVAATSPQIADGIRVGTRFIFPAVSAGEWVLAAQHPLALPGFRDVSVPVGGEVVVEFAALVSAPDRAVIAGRVRLEGAAQHDGIVVRIADQDVEPVVTLPDGEFTLPVVADPEGYVVRFAKPGYDSAEREVPPLVPDAVFRLPEDVVLRGEPGRIAGVVRIDPNFAVRNFLPDVAVRLYTLDAEGQRELVEQTGVLRLPQAEPDDPQEGSFTFADVAPGRYQLEVGLEGFIDAQRAVELPPGGEVYTGSLFLSRSRLEAVLTGRATLACAECSHQGILVEAVGTPSTAITNQDGRYELLVVPGEHTIRFSYPGYDTDASEPTEAVAGEPRVVPDQVLTARPSTIRGQIALPPAFDASALLPQVVAQIRQGEEVIGAPVNPVGDVFTLTEIRPGRYVVSVALDGFVPVHSEITVEPGVVLDLGRIGLFPVGAEIITGQVQLTGIEGDNQMGGVQVVVLGSPYSTVTLANGDFTVQAVPGDDVQLRFARVGWQTTPLSVRIAVGQILDVGVVEVPYDPVDITGTVLRVALDGALVPADGAEVEVVHADGGPDVPPTQVSAEGVFVVRDVRSGPYDFTVAQDGYVAQRRRLQVAPGPPHVLDRVLLDLERGAIRGAVRRADRAVSGGATVSVRRRPNGDVRRTVLTRAPDDAYVLEALPVGTYDLFAFAEGYAPSAEQGVVVAAGGAAIADVELVARRYAMTVEPLWRTSDVEVVIDADPDLTHYRAWLDSALPPVGAAFELRTGGSEVVAAVDDGTHTLYLELATAPYVNREDSPAAFLTPRPLIAPITVDTERPTVRVTALPQPQALPVGDLLYVRTGEALLVDLAAHDAPPSSGIRDLRIERIEPAGPPVTDAFLPRIDLNDIQPGPNLYEIRVVDAAGNESEPVRLTGLIGDVEAPRRRDERSPALGPRGSSVIGGLDVELVLNIADPDSADPDSADPAWPLFYRVHDVQHAPGGWQRLTDAVVPFGLRGGEDGPRTIAGAVQDAAGRIFELNETVIDVDRVAATPTAVSVSAAGQPIDPDAVIALAPIGRTYAVDVTVQVAGADERLVAQLDAPHDGSCVIDGTEGASSCVISSVRLPNADADRLTRVELRAYVVDEVGNASERRGMGFTVDNEAPRIPSASLIGASPTKTDEIVLRLDARDAAHYQILGDVNPVPLTEASFPVDVDVTLSGVDGDKTPVARFFDAAGNVAQASLTVRLDRQPPQFAVELYHGGERLLADGQEPPRINDTRITVRVVTNGVGDDDCTAVDRCRHAQRVSLSPNFEGALFEAFREEVPLELRPVNGLQQVYVQMRDPAGNLSVPEQIAVDLQVEVDRQGPAVPGLRRRYVGEDKIRLEVTPPGDDDLAYYVIERNIPGLDGNVWKTAQLLPAVADDTSEYDGEICAVQQTTCNHTAEDCLSYQPTAGGEPLPLLLEDRAAVLGFEHLYRVRAVDTLGNSSGFSVPLEAGVPIGRPTFSLIRTAASRRLQWSIPDGTFAVDRATYQTLDPDGTLAQEAEIAPGPGQVELPPVQLDDPALERFVLRTHNQDRSMIWESTVLDLGVGRRVVGPDVTGGTKVRAFASADDHIHVTALGPSSSGLRYLHIYPDGREEITAVPLVGAQGPREMLDVTADPVDGTPYALGYRPETGHLWLYELADPNAPVVTDLGAICEGNCFRKVWGGVVVDAQQGIHIGYFHVSDEVLVYHTRPRDGVPTTVVADATRLAGRDVRMVMLDDTPTAVYLEGADGDFNFDAQLAMWQPDGRSGTKTVLGTAIKVSPNDSTRFIDAWAQGSALHFVYTGFVDYLCPQVCTDDVDCSGGGTCITGGLCDYDDINVCNANCEPQCEFSRRALRQGTFDGRSLRPEQSLYLGDATLRSPQIDVMPDGRLVVVAATTSDPNYLFLYDQSPPQLPDAPPFAARTIAEFADGGPGVAMVIDALGRPRIFLDEGPHLFTEMTTDFVLENPAFEFDVPFTPDVPRVAQDLAVAEPAPGQFFGVFREDDDAGVERVYYTARRGAVPVQVIGPEIGPAHRVGNGLAVAAQSDGSRWLLYSGGVTDDADGVWLQALHAPAAPIELAAHSAHGHPNVATRSAKRLTVDGAGTLHTAWVTGDELRYWKRAVGGATESYAFGAAVYARADRLSRNVLTVADDSGSTVLVAAEVNFVGLALFDVTDPHNPTVQEMVTSDFSTLIDVEVGSDGKVWVVYAHDGTTFLAPFGGTPTPVSTRISTGRDTVDLVRGEDGALHLFYTESRRQIDDSWQTTLRYTRPLEGAAPTSVALDVFRHDGEHIYYGLAAWPQSGRAFKLYYFNPNDGTGALDVDGRVHWRTVRPGRAPGVSYRRADGFPTLGVDGDRDEDGRPDAQDNCPDVWNPDQRDLCGGCFANCDHVPDFADLARLTGDTWQLEGSTIGAGANYTSTCGSTATSEDVTYAWTAPAAGQFVIGTGGSGFDTTLYLLDDCDPAIAAVIACDDDSGGDQTSQLVVELDAGQIVYIVVDGFRGANGEFTLTVRPR